MSDPQPWLDGGDAILLTDLYELAMVQAYWAEQVDGDATFSLYFRALPAHRNFMLACGQVHAARLLNDLKFSRDALDKLSGVAMFREEFLRWLEDFEFTGDIHAMAEGTPVFPGEPLLEVTAPVWQAQLFESLVMNLVHLETVLASKAVRMVQAAQGRPVVDFGLRRMHGLDAALRGVRAYRTAGIEGTSNVLGGLRHGLPLRGTMAHSYIQVHEDELDAFIAYAKLYPGTTLLVDTYYTERAVDRIIEHSQSAGGDFSFGAIRLDSGDLAALAKAARRKLDAAGLHEVKILASGGLDEYRIAEFLDEGAPIDGFGVGSALGVSADSPLLELVYKLTEFEGSPRLKNSPGKAIIPGAKQVYRFRDEAGRYTHDEITLRSEQRDAEALLAPVIRGGELIAGGALDGDPARTAEHVAALPAVLRGLDEAGESYPVYFSGALDRQRGG